jgi:hypothetical protein
MMLFSNLRKIVFSIIFFLLNISLALCFVFNLCISVIFRRGLNLIVFITFILLVGLVFLSEGFDVSGKHEVFGI